MKKTFQQFISENPHFCDVQGLRESSDQGAYLRNALEKAWNAGRDSTLTQYDEPAVLRNADLSAAASTYDKRLGATGVPVE